MWKSVSGVFLGWSLGANDSANVFGTGVATGTIGYRTAIWLTAAFVMLGAFIEGPKCMETLSDLSRIQSLEAFVCALSAAATMTCLTFLAVPASTSQAIVGAIIGAGLVTATADFSKLYRIVACWVFTPIGGLLLGYTIHRTLGFVLSRVVRNIRRLNKIYFLGILFGGCYGAYCLGANNVANVTGVYVGSGMFSPETAALVGGLSIASGVLTYSRKVMLTIGKGIVPLDPFSALVAVLAEALTLHLFTQIGVPVSSSQAIVGAVVGIGLVGDVRTISPKMLLKISGGWLVTPLFAGLLSYLVLISLS